MHDQNRVIAYFSLEIGLEPHIPTYSGGLGVLAGDTLRAAADMGIPYAGVTLLYRDGYFRQKLVDGRQIEEPVSWKPEEILEELPQRAYVPIEGRTVHIRAFRLYLTGVRGHRVPIYYLDTDLPENTPQDRLITRALYAGDHDNRIRQEAILGIGGRRMLRAVTHDCICFHMNEGHACFLTVELLSEHLSRFDKSVVDAECVRHARSRCVFTTHTPIEAGHDRFSIDRVRAIIGNHPAFDRPDIYGKPGELNTTILALHLSRFANGVARKHGEVSRAMFPGQAIDSITNGVHCASWASPAMRAVFDKHLPEWRGSNSELRLARGIPADEVWNAHIAGKRDLFDAVASHSGMRFDPDVFTIGFARRSTAYKRPAMLVSDVDRLASIAKSGGAMQIVYAGKAHPHDGRGKDIIKQIHDSIGTLGDRIRVVFLPDYDIGLARKLVGGVDLWLNTPEPPLEASGTSGMKAAINGIPSFSTMDGWWLEGCVEGVTGWGIGAAGGSLPYDAKTGERMFLEHREDLYHKLEHAILPLYYKNRSGWIDVMQGAMSVNGSYFTTERMLRDYVVKAYLE
jgi:starch phosphorylase